MKTTNFGKLVVALAIPQLAGALGSVATMPNIPRWYAGLNKPFFSPPNWIFGPVWITLFALMGVALYMVMISKKGDKRTRGLYWFGVQMALNVAWSFLFFGARSPLLGLIGIIPLWVAIVMTIQSFSKVSDRAARLLWPYLGWVSFATLLNGAVWWLNR